jgi:thioredoxin reductase (NADPH)
MTDTRDTVILGSGCAGLTAAIYTARAGLNPLVLEGHEPGGQLSITTLVENFPGWPEGIQGPELIDNMKKQAIRFGATFQLAHLNSVDLNAHPFRLNTTAGEVHARTLIIASGASARWLGIPSEQALIGHGVSSCATCDGFFFRGKPIAVIGGGDSAMEEALFLTRFASKVTLLHRRDAFRASKIMLERAMAHPNIELRTNTVVDEVLGVDDLTVKGLRLRDVTNGASSELEVEGMFLGIGHVPNAKMFTATSSPRIMMSSFPASTLVETSRTAAIGRPSRLRAPAAWPHSRRKNISKNMAAKNSSRNCHPCGCFEGARFHKLRKTSPAATD